MEVRKGCVTLLSAEPEVLLAFYRDSLGLTVRFAGPRFSELVTGDGFHLALMKNENGPAPTGSCALGFTVSDWRAAQACLEELGLLDREEEDAESGVRLLWFHDPEGRPLYLWEIL